MQQNTRVIAPTANQNTNYQENQFLFYQENQANDFGSLYHHGAYSAQEIVNKSRKKRRKGGVKQRLGPRGM